MRSRAVREGGFALLVYGALTIWLLWPLPTQLTSSSSYVVSNSDGWNGLVAADWYLITWALTWDTHRLLTRPWALFDANTFHPVPLSLAFSEHLLGYVPWFAPTWLLTGNPVLATNILLLLTFPLCALGAYALLRRWTGRGAALVAGGLYGFSLARLKTLHHFHQLGVQYVPLAILFTERWFTQGRRRDLVGLGVSLGLQLLSSYYLAYGTALLYAIYLLAAFVRHRQQARDRLPGLVLCGGAVAALVLVTSLPYLWLRGAGFVPSYAGGDDQPVGWGLRPRVASFAAWEFLRRQGPGPVGYGLATVGIMVGWRVGWWPWFLAILTAGIGGFAIFGPGVLVGQRVLWSPYTLLLDWVPGFSTIRMPVRFAFLVQLGVAWCAALGVEVVIRRMREGWGLVAGGILLAAAIYAWGPLPAIPLHHESTGAEVPPAYRWLADHGGGRPLFEVPGPDFRANGQRVYFSTFHWLPIVDGCSAYTVATSAYLHSLLGGLGGERVDDRSLQELVDTVDIGWVLVHLREVTPTARLAWEGSLPAGLNLARAWGHDRLFRVTRAVREDRRTRFLSPHVTLEGSPLVPLVECPGTLRIIASPPGGWKAGAVTALTFQAENRGPMAWPANGMIPRHLVRIRVCLRPEHAAACPTDPQPIPHDVGAGAVQDFTMRVSMPALPGRYVLDTRLVQVGDGPLARCGVEPLMVPIDVER